jgi:hypothetical protein
VDMTLNLSAAKTWTWTITTVALGSTIKLMHFEDGLTLCYDCLAAFSLLASGQAAHKPS